MAVTVAGKKFPSFFDGFIGLMPTPAVYGEDNKKYSFLESDLKAGNIDHKIFSIYIDSKTNKGSIMFGNYDVNGAID